MAILRPSLAGRQGQGACLGLDWAKADSGASSRRRARGGFVAEAGLSYLGLGIQPPHASWGRMLNEAQTFMSMAPWMVIFPGLAIAWAVLGFNLLGDGLRDTLDPKMVRIR